MTTPSVEQQDDKDATWALERVQRLCASAYIDAAVYGKKLLKGFGYPNEAFRAAQDARALSLVLGRLEALSQSLSEAQGEIVRLKADIGRREETITLLMGRVEDQKELLARVDSLRLLDGTGSTAPTERR